MVAEDLTEAVRSARLGVPKQSLNDVPLFNTLTKIYLHVIATSQQNTFFPQE